jgi:hypothetical protein
MKVDILYYGSAILCVLSFLLFAIQVIKHIWAPPPAPPPAPPAIGGLGGAEQQTLNLQQAIQTAQQAVQQTAKLAETFSKAGPMATSAVLCVVFAFIWLLTSGLIKIQM